MLGALSQRDEDAAESEARNHARQALGDILNVVNDPGYKGVDDNKAIDDATSRPGLRFVAIKTGYSGSNRKYPIVRVSQNPL